nr:MULTISPECIES: DedA family protein [unclassified Halomonas]
MAPSPGWLLVVILVIALTESLAVVGLVVPGVVLMTAAASLAGHYDLSIPLILLFAFVGAVIGDGASFLLGYTQRERIPAFWPFKQHPEWLSRGARFFQRYGVMSVLIGRFVGPVRPVVPMIAGMMRMSPITFAWSNVGSAMLWAPAYVLPGYLLGRTWQQLLTLPPGSDRWLIMLAGIVIVLALVFSLLRHQLAREGRLYRRLAYYASQRGWRRRLWHALRLSYPGGEFPLASLVLLVTSLTALSAWTLWVLERGTPLTIDTQLQTFLAAFSEPLLLQLAAWLAEAGDMLGRTALVLPWLLWLLWRRQTAALLHLLGGLGAITLANVLFGQLSLGTALDTATIDYPSELVSASVVLSGLMAAYVSESLTSRFRAIAYWVAILLSLAMGLACLLLDIAWLSGLVGGALLGLTLSALIRVSYHFFAVQPPLRPPWLTLSLASLMLGMARIVWLPPV